MHAHVSTCPSIHKGRGSKFECFFMRRVVRPYRPRDGGWAGHQMLVGRLGGTRLGRTATATATVGEYLVRDVGRSIEVIFYQPPPLLHGDARKSQSVGPVNFRPSTADTSHRGGPGKHANHNTTNPGGNRCVRLSAGMP